METETPAGQIPVSPPVLTSPVTDPFENLGRRVLAVLEVVLISGIPTQIIVALAWWLIRGLPDLTHPPLEFIAITSLVDTALVALLIRAFLTLSGESSEDVFVGRRRPWGEILRGLVLVPVAIAAVQILACAIRVAFPALHNVAENPYAAYMQTPIEAVVFMIVVILAGGVREELQRAFVIHRFDQYLGGAQLGLILFTVLFGALHYPEGWDAAIVIGLLGLLFGIIYIRRRSAVLNMTAHAGFDAGMVILELFQR